MRGVWIERNITFYRAFPKHAPGSNFSSLSHIFNMQPPLDGKVTLLSFDTLSDQWPWNQIYAFGVSGQREEQTMGANKETKYL